jgi:hypothetical protein
MPTPTDDVTEQTRLNDAREERVPRNKGGAYRSEGQWGTVREDYSHDGTGATSRTISRGRAPTAGAKTGWAAFDDKQGFASPALWNGHDAILKERLFGLTNSEGNHGETPRSITLRRQHADPLA